MKEIAKQLAAYLKDNPAFTAVMPDKLFPFAAPEGTTGAFAVYTVGSEPLTKDGRQYTAALQLFYPVGKFSEMLDFADTCEQILSKKYDVGVIDTDYSPEYKQLFATINFNI